MNQPKAGVSSELVYEHVGANSGTNPKCRTGAEEAAYDQMRKKHALTKRLDLICAELGTTCCSNGRPQHFWAKTLPSCEGMRSDAWEDAPCLNDALARMLLAVSPLENVEK